MKEMRALWSCFKAWLILKDEKRKADRKAAGVISNEQQREWRERG
jgi:hypothetical protein